MTRLLVVSGNDTLDGGAGNDTYNVDVPSGVESYIEVEVDNSGSGTVKKFTVETETDTWTDTVSNIQTFVAGEHDSAGDSITLSGITDRTTVTDLVERCRDIYADRWSRDCLWQRLATDASGIAGWYKRRLCCWDV